MARQARKFKQAVVVADVKPGDTAYIASELMWAEGGVRRVVVLEVLEHANYKIAKCRHVSWHKNISIANECSEVWIPCDQLSFEPYFYRAYKTLRARSKLRRAKAN